MQLFQINQSEDSSKITIMSDTTCGQLHQRPITSASNYNSTTLFALLSRPNVSWKNHWWKEVPGLVLIFNLLCSESHVARGTWRPAHPIIPCQYQNNKYTTVQTRPLLLHQASEDQSQDLGSKCFNCADLWFSSQLSTFTLILKTKVREDFTITEKASTRAYSLMKGPTSAFTFKTLC